ncbi:MAG TPA: c-type cytochrome domain-containing protein [Tepidisphaeraceae bacterium]|nr:c-type cytochrome domain-containing protein [Tepidisphaeraceae bacterium]
MCKWLAMALVVGVWPCVGRAAEALKPISYQKDVMPILTASCIGCHSPEKKKGGLDMSSFGAMAKGGKEGVAFVAGQPDKSKIISMVSGPEPEMPEKGDKLTAAQVEILKRWVAEGAKDDSPVAVVKEGPAGEPGPSPLSQPPRYASLPVITAIQYSPPDGKVIAISGYHEVLLHKPDGSGIVARLVGGSPRIESLMYSGDGKMLAVSGGAPALFGNIQVWETGENKLVKNYKVSRDSVFGVSFSPDGQRMAFGCTDKSARVIQVSNGQEIMRLDQHNDWCLGTAFSLDGKKLVTGSRDQAMKLSDLMLGQFIDDINNPLEPLVCMARHPKEDKILYGGAMGKARIYKISDNQGRTAARTDNNKLREFEQQPGPVHSVAWSADGKQVCLGSVREARVYADDGKKIATLSGHEGAVFAVAFSPDGKQVCTGGFDGMVRIFDAQKGTLIKAFEPVAVEKMQQAAK